jgi:hypothetical protein
LSRGVQVAGAAWHAVIRIMAGVGDLVQRTGDGYTGRVIGARAIERSGGVVCGLHHARGGKERGFLVEPQNQVLPFVNGLASKPLIRFLISLGLKIDGDGFLRYGLKTDGDGFL